MGLFSRIGKAFKRVWKGIKKRFKKVMAKVGKFLDSKLGKIIMLAVTVWSMGTALAAFKGGFTALEGSGFIAKFINGGKAFLNTLVGSNFEVAGQAGQGVAAAGGALTEGAAAEGAVNAGEVLAGVDPTGLGGVLPEQAGVGAGGGAAEATMNMTGTATNLNAGVPASPVTSELSKIGVPELAYKGPAAATRPVTLPSSAVPKVMPAAQEGNWLSKAAKAGMDFAKSPGGANVLGGVAQGYGRAAEVEAFLDEQRRIDDMWNDPNDPGVRALGEPSNVNVPRELAAAPGRLARREVGRRNRGASTVPFRRSAGG